MAEQGRVQIIRAASIAQSWLVLAAGLIALTLLLVRSRNTGDATPVIRAAVTILGSTAVALSVMRGRVEVGEEHVRVIRGIHVDEVTRADIEAVERGRRGTGRLRLTPGSTVSRGTALDLLGKPEPAAAEVIELPLMAPTPIAAALGLRLGPAREEPAELGAATEIRQAFVSEDQGLRPLAVAYVAALALFLVFGVVILAGG